MQRIDADAAGGAAPATSDDALRRATGQGIKEGFGEQANGIVGFPGNPGKPLSAVDADLPAFLKLQTAAARDGWDLSRVVAEGAAVYLLRRLRFSEAFHDLEELSAFLASRGVRP